MEEITGRVLYPSPAPIFMTKPGYELECFARVLVHPGPIMLSRPEFVRMANIIPFQCFILVNGISEDSLYRRRYVQAFVVSIGEGNNLF
jgi:hypothetical protein